MKIDSIFENKIKRKLLHWQGESEGAHHMNSSRATDRSVPSQVHVQIRNHAIGEEVNEATSTLLLVLVRICSPGPGPASAHRQGGPQHLVHVSCEGGDRSIAPCKHTRERERENECERMMNVM